MSKETLYRVKGGVKNQPIQHVEWVSRNELFANNYNPNKVAPPELELLRVSILENGWTQPIVAMPSGQIVDGFHRWTIAKDPEIAELTGGMVPVVRINVIGGNEMMATIRHNRARGTHDVRIMARIVQHLKDEKGFEDEAISELLGMEEEEIDRLYDGSGSPSRAGTGTFNKGWVPH